MHSLLAQFPRTRILVIGDVGLDHFVWGDVERISPEAPVPVVHVNKEHDMPGAAANVALNVAALDAHATIVGIMGNDAHGTRLRTLLEQHNVNCAHLCTDAHTHTTRKTRIIARSQHVVRVDWDAYLDQDAHTRCNFFAELQDALTQCDAVVLQDYHKGLITQDVCDVLADSDVPVIIDPNRYSSVRYHGTVATPNLEEACVLSGITIPRQEDPLPFLPLIAERLLERYNLAHLIITLSERGIALCDKNGDVRTLPAAAVHDVFDVSGAGDTVAAVIATACAAGADLWEACHIANIAGGIVVGKVGTATVSRAELDATVSSALSSSSS